MGLEWDVYHLSGAGFPPSTVSSPFFTRKKTKMVGLLGTRWWSLDLGLGPTFSDQSQWSRLDILQCRVVSLFATAFKYWWITTVVSHLYVMVCIYIYTYTHYCWFRFRFGFFHPTSSIHSPYIPAPVVVRVWLLLLSSRCGFSVHVATGDMLCYIYIHTYIHTQQYICMYIYMIICIYIYDYMYIYIWYIPL